MSLTPTLRRHFRQTFWPHGKTEPILLPFEQWALTWYRYWPASTVPLRENVPKSGAHEWDRRTDRRTDRLAQNIIPPFQGG